MPHRCLQQSHFHVQPTASLCNILKYCMHGFHIASLATLPLSPRLPSSICKISFLFIGIDVYSLNLEGFPFPKKKRFTNFIGLLAKPKPSIHNANSTIEHDKRITYQTLERRAHSRSPKQGHHLRQACLLYEVNWTVHSCLHGARMTSVRARRGRYALSMQKA